MVHEAGDTLCDRSEGYERLFSLGFTMASGHCNGRSWRASLAGRDTVVLILPTTACREIALFPVARAFAGWGRRLSFPP